MNRFIFTIVLASIVCCMTACDQETAGVPSLKTNDSTLLPTDPKPVRVACMVDQTRSTQVTKVPQLQAEDFDLLLAFMAKNSGEIAVGAIREQSNRSLLRCRLEQRPLRTAQPPDPRLNVFVRRKALREYESQKQLEDEREVAWSRDNQRRLAEFREHLKTVLAQAADARRTDINGAVSRADLFLNEPDDGWREPTRRVLLFVSDMADNVRAPFVPLKSKASLLVVNGSATLGSFGWLRPVQLESFSAATRYIENRSKEQ